MLINDFIIESRPTEEGQVLTYDNKPYVRRCFHLCVHTNSYSCVGCLQQPILRMESEPYLYVLWSNGKFARYISGHSMWYRREPKRD